MTQKEKEVVRAFITAHLNECHKDEDFFNRARKAAPQTFDEEELNEGYRNAWKIAHERSMGCQYLLIKLNEERTDEDNEQV